MSHTDTPILRIIIIFYKWAFSKAYSLSFIYLNWPLQYNMRLRSKFAPYTFDTRLFPLTTGGCSPQLFVEVILVHLYY